MNTLKFRGRVQIYTGSGKGKTTAALGLALRAAGHHMKVLMIQFLKGGIAYGEIESAKKLTPYLKIVPMGRECFVNKKDPGSGRSPLGEKRVGPGPKGGSQPEVSDRYPR